MELPDLPFPFPSCALGSVVHTTAEVILTKCRSHTFAPCLSNVGRLPAKCGPGPTHPGLPLLPLSLPFSAFPPFQPPASLAFLQTRDQLGNCPPGGAIHFRMLLGAQCSCQSLGWKPSSSSPGRGPLVMSLRVPDCTVRDRPRYSLLPASVALVGDIYLLTFLWCFPH